jgi:apolipoprotein D and lipocalin family protein
MGQWYEIAALPNWFQKNCVCTTAEYRQLDDYVEVKNTCRDGSSQGKVRKALGKAWVVEGSSGGKLKVSFFWPFRGDYWIIALDPDYQWAMVGHPQRKYLWILSRKPQMEAKLADTLLEQARAMGYPVDQMRMTDQGCRP